MADEGNGLERIKITPRQRAGAPDVREQHQEAVFGDHAVPDAPQFVAFEEEDKKGKEAAKAKPKELITHDGSKEAKELLKQVDVYANGSTTGKAEINPLKLNEAGREHLRARVEVGHVKEEGAEKPETILRMLNRAAVVFKGDHTHFFIQGWHRIIRDGRQTDKEQQRIYSDNSGIAFQSSGKLARDWAHEPIDGFDVRIDGPGSTLALTKQVSPDEGKTATLELLGEREKSDVIIPATWVQVQVLRDATGLHIWMGSGRKVETREDVEKLRAEVTPTKFYDNEVIGVPKQGKVMLHNREPAAGHIMTTEWKGLQFMSLDKKTEKKEK